MMKINKAYIQGFEDGWKECRENLIEKCNLDEEKIIAMERSDE